MKVTDVKSFLVHPTTKSGLTIDKNWLFVKLTTDDGIEGWGEAFTMRDREKGIAQFVEEVGRYVIGRNPFRIKEFAQIVHKFAEGRGSVDLCSAVSGIEQALWDIVGKSLKTPVYNLLGGPCREKIRVYANGWTRGTKSPHELATRAANLIKKGFTAIKFYPFLSGDPEDNMKAVENVRAVREAVGRDVDILIDVWRRSDPQQAIRIARMLEEFNIFWYEEPVPSENADVLAEVRAAVNVPVVTGECLYTKFDFRRILENRAADILNPDVASCGGILQFKEIAAMAEPYLVSISPHNYNSTALGLAATIQVSAVIPNFVIAEYFVSFVETGDAISKNPLRIENGYISLPTGPGLGLEVEEEALKNFPYQRFDLRSL